MKNKLVAFGEWAQVNFIALLVMFVILILLCLLLVLFSWFYGYWSNALWGTHFELASCWTGIGATGTMLATIIGLGKAAWTKYGVDSQFNSALGSSPFKNGGVFNDNKPVINGSGIGIDTNRSGSGI